MATIDYNSYAEKYPYNDSTIVGKALISISPVTDIFLGYPSLGKGIEYNKSDLRVGYCTGLWDKIDGVNYVQVEFELMQGNENLGYYQYGCVRASEYRIYEYGTKASSKSMIDELVENNRQIYENILLCAGLISKLEAKGIPVSSDLRNKLFTLYQKLDYRNNHLLNSSFLKVQSTGIPTGFSTYSEDLNKFVSDPKITGTSRIGILPVVIYIIGSVIITALATWIIYLIFKPDYTDSKADLKVSKDLSKALSSLSPAAKQEVLNDLNGQIDKAYVEGKMSGSGMSTLKTAGYAAAALLGFWGLTSINKNLSSK